MQPTRNRLPRPGLPVAPHSVTYLNSRPHMLHFLEEYFKHAALNFGQALQGVRYIFSHPDIDAISPKGSIRHAALSAGLRFRRIVNDLFFALIPPHWHHTREELSATRSIATQRWFQYGYCAWRFTNDGEIKQDLTGVDRRWDPRCRET